MKIVFANKKSLGRCGFIIGSVCVFLSIGGCVCMFMPGKSYSGAFPEAGPERIALREALESDVSMLSETIGQRNLFHYDGLEKSVEFISSSFIESGYIPEIQEFKAKSSLLGNLRNAPKDDKNIYKNIIAEKRGVISPEEIIVVGAHYDSVPFVECPAANDNASGVAAVLAMAKRFSNLKCAKTIRFAAFTNEEPPYFWTESMGSYVYAKACKEKNEKIIAMITPETIGFYSDKEGSQDYPAPFNFFYPSKGNFIAFVGNMSSASLVRQCVGIFRETTHFPSEGAALPSFLPGVGWSDHWSFWKMGYPALMVTDTAPFRYPHYHCASDTPDKIDFDKMAVVVAGLVSVVERIAEKQ
jgi:hypothetical protein